MATKPRNLYGMLESSIVSMRRARRMDLCADKCSDLSRWRTKAKEVLFQALHYDPGPPDLNPETVEIMDRGWYVQEKICFNTAPWFRVEGYFLIPSGAPRPLPAILLLHEWGGPMLFGKERLVDSGNNCEVLRLFREKNYDGLFPAEEFCRAGYAVLVIDAFHFGKRIPRGVAGIPEDYDPLGAFSDYDRMLAYHHYSQVVQEQLFYSLRELSWAGTTWAGVNFGDDSRCVDYLLTRPEIDGGRIGVTGHSGGGFRTNMMLALDDRIKAGVSVGWMSSGDALQAYNLCGAVGVFNILPGVWNRMDVPDLIAMGYPKNAMMIVGTEDILFSAEGVDEAFRRIREAYERAECRENIALERPPVKHCYGKICQKLALEWFDAKL